MALKITTDGKLSWHKAPEGKEYFGLDGLKAALADWCFEFVYFGDSTNRKSTVMVVDDNGLAAGHPVNPVATQLYAITRVGWQGNPIVGDVLLLTIEELEAPEDDE